MSYLTPTEYDRITMMPIALPETELRLQRQLHICTFVVAQGQRLELACLNLHLYRVLSLGVVPLLADDTLGMVCTGLMASTMVSSALGLVKLKAVGVDCWNPDQPVIVTAPGVYRVFVLNNCTNVDLSVAVTGSVRIVGTSDALTIPVNALAKSASAATVLTPVSAGGPIIIVPMPTAPVAPSGMVVIPSGSFTQGSSEVFDGTPHTLDLPAFYMETNLVTLALWNSVYAWATNHGYSFSIGAGKNSTNPVHTVNWYDVVKWCNARSEMEGLTPCFYTDNTLATPYRTGNLDLANESVKWAASGYQLPTESQWEKAARAGSTTRFYWGDTATEARANYFSNTISFPYDQGPAGYNASGQASGTPYTTAVGTFPPNGYGLYDMAGNVSEWCWDWYATPYDLTGQEPSASTQSPAARVLRGGSWTGFASEMRCAARGYTRPSYGSSSIGFRCIRQVQ